MNKVESALQRTTDTKALVIGVGTLPRRFNKFPHCNFSKNHGNPSIDWN